MAERRFWRLPVADAAALARAAGAPDPSVETLDALAYQVTGALGRLDHALTIGARRVDRTQREPKAIRADAHELADLLQEANRLARRLVLDDALDRATQEAIADAGVMALHLRDRLDADAEGRPRRVPDDINGFLHELVEIYERVFAREARRSCDPATGAPRGPLLRFIRAALEIARARGIKVPTLTDSAIDRRLQRILSGELDPRELNIGTLWAPDD